MAVKGKRTVARKDYKKYIQSKEWQAKKKKFWESKLPKDCYTCKQSGGKMDLHHRTYKNHRTCHYEIHDYQKETGKDLWKSTSDLRRKKK